MTEASYRPPLGGGSVGVAYLTIESRTADRIVAISSPMARAVEIHATIVEGGSASMQPIANVELPAGLPVSFSPGARHLMIFEPEALENDEVFPVTIQLESGRTIDVDCAQDRGPLRGS